jgi:hypothetical protein
MKDKNCVYGYYIAGNKGDKMQMCGTCNMHGRDEKCSIFVRSEEAAVET